MAGDLVEDEFWMSELEGDFLEEEELALIDETVEKVLSTEGASSFGYASKKQIVKPASLESYRSHLGYISVTDLALQHWCEQQMEYRYSHPELLLPAPKHVQQGADIHMAKEMELYDIVPVNIITKEDKWAVIFLNFLTQISALDAGQTVRELPVFAEPYAKGIFVYGVIDELRFTLEGKLELVELKTRSSDSGMSLPSKTQQRKNILQVLTYRKLFNDLVSGKVKHHTFLEHIGLSRQQELSGNPLDIAEGYGLKVKTLGELVDVVFQRLRITKLPEINIMSVEYISQGNCAVLQQCNIQADDEWLEKELIKMIAYWKGDRMTVGVDIEDAWKCQRCDFAQVCVWRTQKDEECRMKNKIK